MMLCVFALGSAEYAAVGVLPDVAGSLRTSISVAGWVVTIYAVTVAVTGPFLTVGLARFSRKRSMIAVMACFAAGNLVCALSPSLPLLLGGRALSALALSPLVAFAIAVVATMVPRTGWPGPSPGSPEA